MFKVGDSLQPDAVAHPPRRRPKSPPILRPSPLLNQHKNRHLHQLALLLPLQKHPPSPPHSAPPEHPQPLRSTQQELQHKPPLAFKDLVFWHRWWNCMLLYLGLKDSSLMEKKGRALHSMTNGLLALQPTQGWMGSSREQQHLQHTVLSFPGKLVWPSARQQPTVSKQFGIQILGANPC